MKTSMFTIKQRMIFDRQDATTKNDLLGVNSELFFEKVNSKFESIQQSYQNARAEGGRELRNAKKSLETESPDLEANPPPPKKIQQTSSAVRLPAFPRITIGAF